MTDRLRPHVVVFDVVETLASLEPVQKRLAELHQPPDLLARWFTRLIRDGMALTSAGSYAGFAEVAASALDTETQQALSAKQITAAVAAFGELTTQPDTVSAVQAASRAGFRLFALSNGPAASTQGFLQRAGLADSFERILSVDEVRAWKPVRAPYELAVRRAGVPAERVALVAVHSWDIHGAHRAGLTTGYCPRLEGRPTRVFAPADVVAETLDGVIDALAALPR